MKIPISRALSALRQAGKWQVLCLIGRAMRLSHRRSPASGRGCVLVAPASPRGLGDEAVLTASVNYLDSVGAGPFLIVTYSADDCWQTPMGCSYLSVPERPFGRWLKFVRSVAAYRYFIVMGTDVMDGRYSIDRSRLRFRLVRMAISLGLDVRIASMSWSDKADSRLYPFLRTLPAKTRICVRDPVSEARVVPLTNAVVRLTADAAFLLQPSATTAHLSEIESWIRDQRSHERLVVGYNVNMNLWGGPENRHVAYQSALTNVRQLMEQLDLSVLLIPHDARVWYDEFDAVRRIYADLSVKERQFCHHVSWTATACEIRRVVADLDLVISGRMHLGVASLAAGVPCAVADYQGKVQGLFKHFGLDDMVLPASAYTLPGAFARSVDHILADLPNMREKVRLRLPAVRALAAANFEGIGSPASGSVLHSA